MEKLKMALTDEDVARIADEMERRMSKRDEKPIHASYGGNGRYTFEDGLGDVYDLGDYMRRPPPFYMTGGGGGGFFPLFHQQGEVSHWLGSYGAEKDFDEMVEFITDELTGEFKITEF